MPSSAAETGGVVAAAAASRAPEQLPLLPGSAPYTLSYVQRRSEVDLWCTSVAAVTLDEFKQQLGVQHPATTRDDVVAVFLAQSESKDDEERVAVERCPARRVLAECHGGGVLRVYEPSVLEQRRTVCLLNNSDWREDSGD